MRAGIVFALAAAAASACASSTSVTEEPPPTFHRFFLTAPSHAAGFEMEGRGVPGTDSRDLGGRAESALRAALLEGGFTVVDRAEDADGILELTVGGMDTRGEAQRVFVALRDARTGRLEALFRAHTRADPQSVEDLVTAAAEVIDQMVRVLPRAPVPPER